MHGISPSKFYGDPLPKKDPGHKRTTSKKKTVKKTISKSPTGGTIDNRIDKNAARAAQINLF